MKKKDKLKSTIPAAPGTMVVVRMNAGEPGEQHIFPVIGWLVFERTWDDPDDPYGDSPPDIYVEPFVVEQEAYLLRWSDTEAQEQGHIERFILPGVPEGPALRAWLRLESDAAHREPPLVVVPDRPAVQDHVCLLTEDKEGQ